MTTRAPLLVSAGEPSGDRIAALTLEALGPDVPAMGLGGDGCRRAGMEVIASVADVAVMGWLPVARKARTIGAAFRALLREAHARDVRAALLVGFTSFNQALGRRLRSRGVRVLWCVAPQVWAWRPSRLASLRTSVDRLAVILPFEQALWSKAGYDTHYVGHPATEATSWKDEGEDPRPRLAVLTGSRDQEVRMMARPMLRGARRWCDAHPAWRADVLLAPSLSVATEQYLVSQARAAGLHAQRTDAVLGAAPSMHRYALSLCASGTASLESALAGVPPVVGYRCDPISALVARRLLRSEHIALPNVLLERRAFPELLQRNLREDRITAALDVLLERLGAHRSACRRVRDQMWLDDGKTFGQRVAGLLE